MLEAGGGVADGVVAERFERGRVGELWQHLERVGDERLGPLLLFGGDPGDAGEVDGCCRVPWSWPGGCGPLAVGFPAGRVGARLGRTGAVVAVGVAVAGGVIGDVSVIVARDVDLGDGFVVVGGLSGVAVAVNVGRPLQHRDDREGADSGRRQADVRRLTRPMREQRPDRPGGGDCSEAGAHGVDELGRLGSFEAIDERDRRDPGDDPRADGRAVDERRQDGGRPAAPHQREQADGDLGGGDRHHQSRQRLVVGVDADCRRVDQARADGRRTDDLAQVRRP